LAAFSEDKERNVVQATPLWTPSEERIRDANLTKFLALVNDRYQLKVKSYPELHRWSVNSVSDFWSTVWDYTGIVSSRRFEKVVDDVGKFPGAKWFPGARLNFAENLLRRRDDSVALVSRTEEGRLSQTTYFDLYQRVGNLANALRKIGVLPGDRVAGYMPNIQETPVAMLGATSIGGVWACCGAELGSGAVLDRLRQIEPKVLFAADGYMYKGKKFDILPNVKKVVDGVPSLKKIILASHIGLDPKATNLPASVAFDDFCKSGLGEARFEQLPPDHPVYIMFTSGTTGKPKCMVQGAAGVLVNQLKETMLHADVKSTDCVTYIASPSWMMWNWLISCLASGARIVLHDGNPLYPDWGAMWKLVQEEKVSILGCSASYLTYLRNMSAKP
jgi:acetoacetyl-CoA synthetase